MRSDLSALLETARRGIAKVMPEEITNDGDEDILQVDESAEDDDIEEMGNEGEDE